MTKEREGISRRNALAGMASVSLAGAYGVAGSASGAEPEKKRRPVPLAAAGKDYEIVAGFLDAKSEQFVSYHRRSYQLPFQKTSGFRLGSLAHAEGALDYSVKGLDDADAKQEAAGLSLFGASGFRVGTGAC